MNVERQIAHWRDGVPRAMRSVPTNVEAGWYSEALFFTHLAVEKALKACVAKRTENIPPKIHNLKRLAELAETELSHEQRELCDLLMRYQVRTRYEDMEYEEPSREEATATIRRAEEMIQWLMKTL